MREKSRPITNRKKTYQEKNVSTACRNELLEEKQSTEAGRELNRATEEGIIKKDFKRWEVRQDGIDSVKGLREK